MRHVIFQTHPAIDVDERFVWLSVAILAVLLVIVVNSL
jgi:hypothetical protein